eukprot:scaffold12204_cov61-Phaeocystis_antarctica.AAC.10
MAWSHTMPSELCVGQWCGAVVSRTVSTSVGSPAGRRGGLSKSVGAPPESVAMVAARTWEKRRPPVGSTALSCRRPATHPKPVSSTTCSAATRRPGSSSQQPAATRQGAGLQRAVAWQQLLGEQTLTLELLICVDLLALPAQAGHPLLQLLELVLAGEHAGGGEGDI